MAHQDVRTLDQLGRGEQAAIRAIHAAGPLGQRLFSLGLLPGTTVKVIQVAPLGDPVTVQTSGFQVSLRKSEARFIEIEGIDE